MNKLSTKPPKGTADWLPEELQKRRYIFETWRRVCQQYGYQEYLTPLVERAEVYRAKSGEDIGGKELVTFTDRAGRELCIRPEMTPSVTRMVSQVYETLQKPVRLFSIANFMRNENPQRGRNREFWQLNCDLFGSEALSADIEVLQLALDLMLAFQPPQGSFVLSLNHRSLIDGVLAHVGITDAAQKMAVVRTLDKWQKLDAAARTELLSKHGITAEHMETLEYFMTSTSHDDLLARIPALSDNESLQAVGQIIATLQQRGYGDWVRFAPDVIRGFDYYDGMVFEVFDQHPENNRSLFGGGRYNGLADLFGSTNFPAVGFAPGDETLYLFLESWNLFTKMPSTAPVYYVPLLDEALSAETAALATQLRQEGKQVLSGLAPQRIGKALATAQKQGCVYVVLYGMEEKEQGSYKIKEMATGEEKVVRM